MQMVSTALLFWLYNLLNAPAVVEEIGALHAQSLEQQRAIAEGEIQAASLVHELRNPLNS
jgi:hypothetical protein